jgi:hypothetical protein
MELDAPLTLSELMALGCPRACLTPNNREPLRQEPLAFAVDAEPAVAIRLELEFQPLVA